MAKANQRKYIDETSHLFESYTSYTPTGLRSIADYMENRGIINVEFSAGYDGFECIITRPETEKEMEKRIKKEQAQLEKSRTYKEKQRADLIKKAKQMKITAEELQ